MNNPTSSRLWVQIQPAQAVLMGTGLAAVVGWEILSRVFFGNLQLIFPPLTEVLEEGYELLAGGIIIPHLIATLKAVGISFGLAALLGVAFGLLFGSTEFLARAVEPLLYYVSTVPKIVFYPLLIMTLGIGLESKIGIGFLSAVFPVLVNTITGALNVNSIFVEVARDFRATRWQIFTRVYVPSVLPYIVNGLRLGIGVAFVGVILGELFVSEAGLGQQASSYFSTLQISKMYAVLMIVFVLAFLLNQSLLVLQDYLDRRGYGAGKRWQEAVG